MPDKPSLILLIPSLAGGGAQRVAINLIPYLNSHFNLTLAVLEDQISYQVPKKINKVAFSPRLMSNFSHIIRIPFHIYSLFRLIRTTKSNIVLSILEQANIINILTKIFAGHTTIISQHSEPIRQYKNKGLLGKIIFITTKLLYPQASHIICVSHQLKEILIRHYSLTTNSISVIYNPIDQSSFFKKSKEDIKLKLPNRFILHVGRMQLATKAQDILISAFKTLNQKEKNLCLVLVGDGDDRSRIEELIQNHSLQDSILLLGWQQNVAAIMAKSQLLVLSSRYEGLPMVLIEAMSIKCPVISTDCISGPREILGDNKYGILVPVDNPTSLANSISSLLYNNNLLSHYKDQAKLRSKDFHVQKIGNEYNNVIRSFLKGCSNSDNHGL